MSVKDPIFHFKTTAHSSLPVEIGKMRASGFSAQIPNFQVENMIGSAMMRANSFGDVTIVSYQKSKSNISCGKSHF